MINLIEAITMTKRLHYTLEEVMDHLSDEEDDYDPDQPMWREAMMSFQTWR